MLNAIILAGERTINKINTTPGALIRIDGKELISHQINYLKDKVSKIIISIGNDNKNIE